MTRRASPIAAGAFLLAVLAPPGVRAADTAPAASTGATPSFETLPEGHVAGLPAAIPPKRIAAGEKVAGLFPTPMPAAQAKQFRFARENVSLSYLFPDEDRAKTFARSGGNRDDGADACLVDGGTAEELKNALANADDPHDWNARYASFLSYQFETVPALGQSHVVRSKRFARSSRGGEVHAVHSERFVPGADGYASLEIADAWFDARTRGVRLLGRSALPLSRVFVGPNGLEVYAARDADALQIVFHAADHAAADPALADELRTRLRSMSVTMPDRNSGNADCGHLRVVLRAPTGVGQMATLQSTAFLSPLDGDFGQVPHGESDEARGSRMFQAMRQRSFQVSVSATTSSADRSPVVSIALAWTGRERVGG